MAGNSTLYELRELLKRKLNAHQGDDFWTDADLNAYLEEEFQTFQRIAVKKNAEMGRSYYDATMPAETTELDIPLTTLDPAAILSIEDRTTYQPGPLLDWAEGFDHIQMSLENTLVEFLGRPNLCFVERVAGHIRIYTSPKSSEARSLRLHLQLGPGDFSSSDNIKSGLPDYVEKCIVLAAAITARNQEQNFEAIQVLSNLLRQAKVDMTRQLRSLNRDAPRVRDVYAD